MRKTKFTPGPWMVHPYRYKTPHHVTIDVGPSGVAVANVIGRFEGEEAGPEAEATAKLISAAPDLLGACEYLTGCKDWARLSRVDGKLAKAIAMAINAIEKARGRR